MENLVRMESPPLNTRSAASEDTSRDDSAGQTSPSNAAVQPARASTFRKFRELLMVKRFEHFDNTPIFVLPGLFIGSLGAASNLEGLQAAGITHILCVASSLPVVAPEQFKTERLPLADLPSARLADVIPAGIAFIDRAISSGGCVLVHCFVGRSRSASMIIAYLIARHEMSLDTALRRLKSVRPQVQPNSGFLIQLRAFEQSLEGEAKNFKLRDER